MRFVSVAFGLCSVLFFFFKQKTAYEMRISDWSSDVCSSDLLAIAESGLQARAHLNAAGDNESGFLDPLREILARGLTPAEQLLARYHGEWQGDVSRVYDEMSF